MSAKTPKTFQSLKTCWALLLLALAAPAAQAHDTAILPTSFRVVAGAPLTVQVSAGHGLTPLNGPRRRRLGNAALIGVRSLQRHRRWRYGDKRSLLGFARAPAGPAMLALRTPLSYIEINDHITGHYLDEVQPPAAQRALWEAQRERGEGWCEWYAKDARTYLRGGAGTGTGTGTGEWAGEIRGEGGTAASGAAAGSAGWRRLAARAARLKQRLELLPLNDPTRLRKGGSLRVALRLDGLPVADVALRLFDRLGHEQVLRTDARGHARFVLARRGPHLITTTVLQAPTAALQPWRSRFGTLGFHVGKA